MASKQKLFQGAKTGSPIAIGYLPIAVAFGALALEAGLTVLQAVGMSAAVFAGASQFMAIGMLLSGAGPFQIIIATFCVNLRHLIMSLTVADRLGELPGLWKLPLSFGVTDETFAVLSLHTGMPQGRERRLFALGLMAIAYAAWVGGTLLGGGLAHMIPPSLSSGMAVALYAMFIGLLIPAAKKVPRLAWIAVIGMGLCYILHHFLDKGWSVVLATVLGGCVGMFIHRR